MKKLLTLAMLVFGVAAFASDGVNPGTTCKTNTDPQEAKKVIVKSLEEKDDKDKDRPKTKVIETRRNACSTCTGVDPRFDVGGYFVEFINRNNLKLVKFLTE
ncbi:hypothetical protein LRS05_04515 [Flavobacterium sp. J372]|uniref:hypothetical protein n=1 Tax=Flavobacterium sp. J372 TaxID=2898436 RepID=UPI002151B70E|nr:hypothetical protein [Flavobacterium sp. J372]MCR5861455.1 hypothetical protein [Flavobacterium sp. J372]